MESWNNSFRQKFVVFTHSFRFRLVLWFVLILAIVMGVFSGFISWRQSQDIRSISITRLNFTLEHLLGPPGEREGVIEGLQTVSPEIFTNTTGSSTNLEEGAIIALQASDGKILESTGVLTAEQIQQLALPLPGWKGVVQVDIPETAGISNRYLFIDPQIQENGLASGYLLVGVPLDANNQLGRLLVSLIFGNLLTLAIALTGGFWLADRAMRPVRTITQTARQISETDLQARLHLPGKDELSELGNTFDDMLNRLQAAFERQRQFTADASHELRTPLTIIDLETTRGLSSRRHIGEYERILGTIQSENKFMIRLVSNLLALARMDAGQMSLKRETLDLGELTSEVIERMGPIAAAQGVTLNVSELPDVKIYGDHATMVQMLTNLVENAIKYSAGVIDPLVQVSMGTREEDGMPLAWVKVSDNGIGIAPENQGRIFDRFYQVNASRNRTDGSNGDLNRMESSGTGLGLAIAQWVARAHHGEIRVQSVLKLGSTFEVVLPLMK